MHLLTPPTSLYLQIMRRRKAAAAARADWSTAPLTVAPFQGVSVSCE